jgi:ABC-type glycerol-3-phosphate transport system substrate-binding protein
MRRSTHHRCGIAVISLMLFSLVLAGCGDDDDAADTSEATTTTAAAATTAAATTTTEGMMAPGDVSVSSWQYEERPGIGDWWQQATDTYEEMYGGSVTIRNLPTTEYGEQLVIETAAGSAADVIMVSHQHMAEMAAGGFIMPLNDLVERDNFTSRVAGEGWNQVSFDGDIMAIPVAGRTLEMIYNQCLLEEAGVTSVPTSPEEYLEAARALTKTDDDGNVTQFGSSLVSANEDPTYETLLMWTIAHGGTHFVDDSGNWIMTSQPVVDALTFMKTMSDEGLIPRGLTESDQRALFATGKTAMTIDGQWQFPFILDNNADNYDCYQSARHPWDGPGTGGMNTALAINSDVDNVESAWAYIKVVNSPELSATFGDHSPIIPFAPDAATPEQMAARPYLTPWIESIGSATKIAPPGHAAQFSQIWPIIVDGVVSVLQADEPVEDALATVQAELEECCG